jgi:hypothetical protein
VKITRFLTAAVVCLALPTACASDDDPAPAATPAATPVAEGSRSTAAAPAFCTPKPIRAGVLEGDSEDGTSVWALLFRSDGPVRVGEQVKIVVRMTGAGALDVAPIEPDGSTAVLDWGPEPHGGSTFQRPGAEWGFGVTFTEPGCWTIALRRTDSGSGYLQLKVV